MCVKVLYLVFSFFVVSARAFVKLSTRRAARRGLADSDLTRKLQLSLALGYLFSLKTWLKNVFVLARVDHFISYLKCFIKSCKSNC